MPLERRRAGYVKRRQCRKRRRSVAVYAPDTIALPTLHYSDNRHGAFNRFGKMEHTGCVNFSGIRKLSKRIVRLIGLEFYDLSLDFPEGCIYFVLKISIIYCRDYRFHAHHHK